MSKFSPQDGDSGRKKKPKAPRFSSDLFIRRVHLLVGEVLEPVWRDPRLAALPQEAVSRLLAAVLELMQSLHVKLGFLFCVCCVSTGGKDACLLFFFLFFFCRYVCVELLNFSQESPGICFRMCCSWSELVPLVVFFYSL